MNMPIVTSIHRPRTNSSVIDRQNTVRNMEILLEHVRHGRVEITDPALKTLRDILKREGI